MKVDYVRFYRPNVTAEAANIELDEEKEGTLDASSSTGYDLTYTWTAPSGISLADNESKIINFTAPSVEKDSTIIFTLEVNDGFQEKSKQVSVLVKNTNTVVGVSKLDKKNNIAVYPNPVKDGQLHLESIEFIGDDLKYSIYSMTGTFMQMGLISGAHSKSSINVDEIPAGCYMIQLTNKNIKTASRFIKLK